MPKWLRYGVYSVLLALSLYMYALSGQRPVPATAPPPQRADIISPLQQSGSLNVRRDVLTGAFENIPFNLRFDFVPLADGRSRVIGRSVDGNTTLELVGPPESVTSANLMAALPEDRPLVRLRNLNAISLLIEETMAEWEESSDWLGANIDRAFSGSGVSTQANGKRLVLSRAPGTETLVVTVTGPVLAGGEG